MFQNYYHNLVLIQRKTLNNLDLFFQIKENLNQKEPREQQ